MITLHDALQATSPRVRMISGSFGLGIFGATASYTWPIAAGADLVITANDSGAPGNDLDFQATADGTAKAGCTIPIDTDALVITHNVGGTTKNGLRVTLVPGGTAGAELASEDPSGNLLVAFQSGVSTVTQIATAIDAHANWICASVGTKQPVSVFTEVLSGGTAPTWAEEGGSPSLMHLHFTDAVSTGTDCKNAINAVSGKHVTATGGDANAAASGDAVGKQDLAGGITGGAIASEKGEGYSVAQTAKGTYTITFDDYVASGYSGLVTVQLNTAADLIPIIGAFDPAYQTVILYTWDKSDGALADVAVHANNRMNFVLFAS